jgi:hypothetical protein
LNLAGVAGLGEFRPRYTYSLTAEVGVGKLGSWRDWHEAGFRRFGVTFGRGVRWAIKASWRAWRKALTAQCTDASPVPRPAANANGDKYFVPGTNYGT